MFNMKVLLVACVLTLVSADLMKGYHGPIGIPEAARIKQAETTAEASRIVGGIAVSLGVYPYFVGLLITLTTGQASVCGGVLLSNRRVLTAGTCWFDGYFQGRAITVAVGTNRLYTGGTRPIANGVFVHPEFRPNRHVNDLAILSIPTVVLNNNVAAVRLPSDNNSYSGLFLTAVGYGRTGEWSAIASDQGQSAVTLPVLSNLQCAKTYPTIVTDGILCTSGNNGWGVCGGDAGGPLVYNSDTNQTLVGIIIGPSPNGCQAGLPSLYTKVYPHVQWINSML